MGNEHSANNLLEELRQTVQQLRSKLNDSTAREQKLQSQLDESQQRRQELEAVTTKAVSDLSALLTELKSVLPVEE